MRYRIRQQPRVIGPALMTALRTKAKPIATGIAIRNFIEQNLLLTFLIKDKIDSSSFVTWVQRLPRRTKTRSVVSTPHQPIKHCDCRSHSYYDSSGRHPASTTICQSRTGMPRFLQYHMNNIQTLKIHKKFPYKI
jgi:hypothetical protein